MSFWVIIKAIFTYILPVELRRPLSTSCPLNIHCARACVCTMCHVYIPNIFHGALSCIFLPIFLQPWSLAVMVIAYILQHATCDTTTKHAAKQDTLQCTVTQYNALQRSVTHCDALQHTATNCNTLRHSTKSSGYRRIWFKLRLVVSDPESHNDHFFWQALWMHCTAMHTSGTLPIPY